MSACGCRDEESFVPYDPRLPKWARGSPCQRPAEFVCQGFFLCHEHAQWHLRECEDCRSIIVEIMRARHSHMASLS
jgi:hypothetical protein